MAIVVILRPLRNTAVLVRADIVAPEGACLHETHGCLRKTLSQSSGMLMAHQMVLRLLVACSAQQLHVDAQHQPSFLSICDPIQIAWQQAGESSGHHRQPVVATPFGVPQTSLSFDPVSL